MNATVAYLANQPRYHKPKMVKYGYFWKFNKGLKKVKMAKNGQSGKFQGEFQTVSWINSCNDVIHVTD